MVTRLTELSARAALRAATSSVHERLHAAPPFLALSEGRLTRDRYGALLSRMAGYYFAAARHLLIEPTRLQRLEQDLVAIDAPPPPVLDLLRAEGKARALGWRYVVEGSIFGGRVIYGHLDYLFGDEESGRSFFSGRAVDVGQWRALCAELEDVGAASDTIDQMIEGALDAFAAFEDTLAAEESAHA